MSVPMELKTITRKLLEQLLVCRPVDMVNFAMQYYTDERGPQPPVRHAVHSLMFLLRRPTEFRAAVGTVYCDVLLRSKINRDGTSSQDDVESAVGHGSSGTDGGGEEAKGSGRGAAEAAEGAAAAAVPEGKEGAGGDVATLIAKESAKNDGEGGDGGGSENESEERGKDTNSPLRSAIFNICRGAILAASPSGRPVSGTANGESQDWICHIIENTICEDLLTESLTDTPDFETTVALIRTYLSLRLIAGCVHELMAAKESAAASAYLTGKEDTALASAPAPDMQVTMEKIVQPEDTALLEQLISSATKNPEIPIDPSKVVSVVISQYLALLIRDAKA